MVETLRTISPVDGSEVASCPLADATRIRDIIDAAQRAQLRWRDVPLTERVACVRRFVAAFVGKHDEIARELTLQMGRPISQSPGEVDGLAERALHMADIAEDSLADVPCPTLPGFRRFIRKDPLGVVLVIAPWNYPYLTAVNSVVPAILAGNSVVLRHSAQTPLCAERLAAAFDEAGLPEAVIQVLHCKHEELERLIAGPGVDHVVFTGSVGAGRIVQRAAAERFIGVGLELGGKDPAYVRADVDLNHAVPELMYGAFYNSGQSCCGVERIYVHTDIYETFIHALSRATGLLRLGNPLESDTSLGPMVRASAAEFVRGQIADAVAAGASTLIDPADFPADAPGTPYLAPQVLADVDHGMRVMTEESFGPVVGVMRVADDDEAVTLMNDSAYGLTASVWTQDEHVGRQLGERVETGTWFMNRCDYVDPALAWSGVKDSGRGCALSPLGFDALTRTKSFHLRLGPGGVRE